MDGWSLKYQEENSTSTELIVVFGRKKEDNVFIASNGFFLIGLNNYEAANYNDKAADIKRTKSLPNGSEKITVILYDNQDVEIDRMIYDKDSIGFAGQSLERKAFLAIFVFPVKMAANF